MKKYIVLIVAALVLYVGGINAQSSNSIGVVVGMTNGLSYKHF